MRADDSNRISFDDFSFMVKLKIAKYKKLISILKIILTIRLGTPGVKRGPSCDANLLEENTKCDSIFSKPLNKDHLVSKTLRPRDGDTPIKGIVVQNVWSDVALSQMLVSFVCETGKNKDMAIDISELIDLRWKSEEQVT